MRNLVFNIQVIAIKKYLQIISNFRDSGNLYKNLNLNKQK